MTRWTHRVPVVLVAAACACCGLVTPAYAQSYTLNFVDIAGGTFTMGEPEASFLGPPGTWDAPEHSVTLGDFRMSETEVTNAQFVAFLNSALDAGLVEVHAETAMGPDAGATLVYGTAAAPAEYASVAILNLSGTRVMKDHLDDGDGDPFTGVIQPENPLNISYIGYDEGRAAGDFFYVKDPRDSDDFDWPALTDYYNYTTVTNQLDESALLNDFSSWPELADYPNNLPTQADVSNWPVSFVRWYGAKAFALFQGYDLPTEAEWEYAGRGGAAFAYATYNGAVARDGTSAIWNHLLANPALGHVQDVKVGSANPYGLYNMAGNVWEWVEDWYDAAFYTDATDPVNTTVSARKVRRGGSWNYHEATLKTPARASDEQFKGNDHFGFRVVSRQVVDTSLPENWQVDPSKYQYSMSVVGQLKFDGLVSTGTDEIVAAFAGTEVRGVANPIDSGGKKVFYMLVFASAAGETLTFKAYDGLTGAVTDLPISLVFEIDGTAGSTGDPLIWETTRTAPTTPSVTLPADGSTVEGTGIALDWGAADGASSYDVEVSTDPAFGSLVASVVATEAVSYDVTGLSAGTTYYWRVRSRNSGGTSEWSVARQFSTASLGGVDLLTPTDGSTGVGTTLQLLWSSSATQIFDLQVSTSPEFGTTVVAETGLDRITYVLRDLAGSTTYYWRVRSAPGDWSATFSFTTAFVAAPLAPTPSNPSNGVDLQVREATLSWGAVSGAASYDLQLGTSSGFMSSVLVDLTGVSQVSYPFTGAAWGTTYYWRVRAVGAGGTGAWSVAYSFSVIQEPLVAPTLSIPPDGATDQSTSLWLNWQGDSGATAYDFQVASDNLFSDIAVSQVGVLETQFELRDLVAETEYFWRVRVTRTGEDGPWSDAFRFTTAAGQVVIQVPSAPTNASPATGTDVSASSVTLTWSAAAGALLYEVQAATDSGFTQIFFQVSGLQFPLFLLENLVPNTTYHWRARGVNSAGEGEWSTASQFTFPLSTTGNPVGEATLLAPLDGSVDQATTSIWLVWLGASDATGYRLQVATSRLFFSTVLDETVAAGPYEFRDLNFSTEYFWRVKIIKDDQEGAWSTAFTFTTLASLPAAPTLLAPADDSQNQPTTLWLIWLENLSSSSYDLELTRSGEAAVRLDNLPDARHQLVDVVGGQDYEWRVRARNGSGVGPWSTVFSFQTVSGVDREDESVVPAILALGSVYPNPVSATATFPFELPEAGWARLTVYDLAGRLVERLVDGHETAGRHTRQFNPAQLPAGAYLYRLEFEDQTQVRVMVVNR